MNHAGISNLSEITHCINKNLIFSNKQIPFAKNFMTFDTFSKLKYFFFSPYKSFYYHHKTMMGLIIDMSRKTI